MSCTFHEFESVHGLVNIFDGGRDIAHNEGKGVACQGILKKASKL